MKSVFVAGSRKFHKEIQTLLENLKENHITAYVAGRWDESKADTLENERKRLLSAFERIEKTDICYVYSKEGYIGKTVAMEIAFAFSRKKEIISSEDISELSAQALITRTMNGKELIDYCK
jgi:hypothetical protein